MRMHRYSLALRHEVMYIFMHFNRGSFADYVKKTHVKYIKALSPAEYVDELTPSYSPGCKRFILDAGYLKALHRPNLILNWDGIERIAENGIVTKKGEHLPFDVIIYATGFQVAASTYELRGSEGETLHKYWKDHGGPTAYLGTTVPGFPNFSIIGGPNTGTGHASQIFTEEVQINYALKLYAPVLSGALSSVEPTDAATDAYNEAIQRRLSTSVWSSCASWYRSGATGKIFSIFPGPVSLFWWYLRSPKWKDYRIEGEERQGTWTEQTMRIMCTLVFGSLTAAGGHSIWDERPIPIAAPDNRFSRCFSTPVGAIKAYEALRRWTAQAMAAPTTTQVAIVGAGFGGLGFGMWLKKRLPCEDFVIFEKGSDIGGTWMDNTYPGCGSDISIHWYSLSTDLKPDWRASHGTQPEILDYMHAITAKYALREHCVFNTVVISATWDKVQQLYIIVTKNLRTGETKETRAKILISAGGVLSEPRMPDVSGIEDFRGDAFHSARWRHDVDLRGKKVAIIVRADNRRGRIDGYRAVLPHADVDKPLYSERVKWIFAHVPFVMRLHRYSLAFRYEWMFLFMHLYQGPVGDYGKKVSTDYIKAVAPAEYIDQLTPSYPPGCRRMVLDTNYLKALHRPNLTPNWDTIERITEDGITMKNGQHLSFDVIIYATGFQAGAFSYELRGSKGQTIQEYFNASGGPRAYLGTTIPGFPNFCTILGPNTASGHASAIFIEEVQVRISSHSDIHDSPSRRALL
ncbi:hypothetical protein EWM64_g500 [Hericium alpestre]|uniref:FAD/NAD(P)-binding domain-containing protein n=1 Tax=Hericium alpestre TaxID=135208 RepID=A0A4Z0ACQ8_9AGAM|nr:hypothetical protein EWM64_g500 [Hericium alpestre]